MTIPPPLVHLSRWLAILWPAALSLNGKEMRKFGFVGYTASGIEGHLFPGLFSRLPRLNALADWLCRIDEKLEGSSFLLATSVRAVKA